MAVKLTPIQRHVWCLSFHGAQEPQIMAATGLDVGNVRKALSEANAKARKAQKALRADHDAR